ncbi:MAG: hypothetical protein AAGH82_11125 [Pseudomonadota bacterium]
MTYRRNNSTGSKVRVKAKRRDPQTPGHLWLAIPLLLALLFALMPGADAAMRLMWLDS